MYRVVKAFRDSKNNEYYYSVGDTYPVEGYKPSKARISELVKGTNKLGEIFLEEVKGASAPDTEE